MSSKAARWHTGESLIYGIHCGNDTKVTHRAKLVADGHVVILDHPRGEPSRTLLCHELSGEMPDGCYAILAAVRGRPHVWVRVVNFGEARTAGFAGQLVVARGAVHNLRAMLREGGLNARRVQSVGSPARWVISADREKAEAVAAADLPIGAIERKRTLTSFGGFVVVRVPGLGRIYWDVALPGVGNLLSQGDELTLPGPLALVRLSRQLLRGWRGVLNAGATGGRGESRPALPEAPCRPSA